MIYHYTSIETLELILKTGKLRFGRLDNVDDRAESEPFKNKPIADKIFVSCWTENKNENVALWKMYGDDFKGVRIGLKPPFFDCRPILSKKGPHFNIINPKGKSILFLPNEMLTDEYFIIPSFMTENTFYKRIEYVPYDTLEKRYEKLTIIETQDRINYEISLDFHKIAKYKSEEWKVQEETRFVLGIIPLNISFKGRLDFESKGFQKLFVSEMLDAIINERKLPFNYFDVGLNPEALKNVRITVGPKSDFNKIEKLSKSFGLNYSPTRSIVNLK